MFTYLIDIFTLLKIFIQFCYFVLLNKLFSFSFVMVFIRNVNLYFHVHSNDETTYVVECCQIHKYDENLQVCFEFLFALYFFICWHWRVLYFSFILSIVHLQDFIIFSTLCILVQTKINFWWFTVFLCVFKKAITVGPQLFKPACLVVRVLATGTNDAEFESKLKLGCL